MNPMGERNFPTAELAKAAAQKNSEVTSFVVLQSNPRPFMPPEFAWIGPVEFFGTRSMLAQFAGIKVIEMVTK